MIIIQTVVKVPAADIFEVHLAHLERI